MAKNKDSSIDIFVVSVNEFRELHNSGMKNLKTLVIDIDIYVTDIDLVEVACENCC